MLCKQFSQSINVSLNIGETDVPQNNSNFKAKCSAIIIKQAEEAETESFNLLLARFLISAIFMQYSASALHLYKISTFSQKRLITKYMLSIVAVYLITYLIPFITRFLNDNLNTYTMLRKRLDVLLKFKSFINTINSLTCFRKWIQLVILVQQLNAIQFTGIQQQ